MAARKTVTINVGGEKIIQVKPELFSAAGDNQFVSMFSERWHNELDEEGRFFVDYSPQVFVPLIEFLRLVRDSEPHVPAQVVVDQQYRPAWIRMMIVSSFHPEVLRKAGVKIHELRAVGCDAKFIRDAGFTAAEQQRAHLSDCENETTPATIVSKGAGKMAGKSSLCGGLGFSFEFGGKSEPGAARISNPATSSHPTAAAAARELVEAGYSPQELREAGLQCRELKQAGLTLQQLWNGGFGVMDLVQERFSCQQLIQVGATLRQLQEAGLTFTILAEAGFTLEQFLDGGFTVKELRQGGFSAQDLSEAGITLQELRQAGFDIMHLKRAGFTPQQLLDSGFTIQMLRGPPAGALWAMSLDSFHIGFTARELSEAGLTLQQLREVFDLRELLQAGFTRQQLTEIGFSAQELQRAGQGLRLPLA